MEERLRHLLNTRNVQTKVIAPIPWFPIQNRWFGRYAVYPSVPSRELRHGIEVLHPRYPVIPKLGMSMASTALARSVLATLSRVISDGYDFDLIDAHYLYPDGVAAAWIGQRLRRPVVLTARGTDVNVITRYRTPRRRILWAADRAARIIAVSQALCDTLVRLGVEKKKIVVLRNGVDLKTFEPEDRRVAREKLGVHRKLWLSVGNLVELKGHHIVVEGVAREPDVDLIVIGDGPEKRRLEKLARTLGIQDRIKFIDYVPKEDLRTYYSAADALILASSREGMPNVVLESIACGTPVIATSVGGIPEVITGPEAGELMVSRDVTALRQAWMRLLERPVQHEKTRQYAEHFGWQETSEGQWNLFKALLEQGRSREERRGSLRD